MNISYYQSPLGVLEFSFHRNQLVHISFDKKEAQKWRGRYLPKEAEHLMDLPPQYVTDLDNYFQGKPVAFNWPLSLIGTPFQIRVWNEIRMIPYGKVSTYKKIAGALNSRAYRAVGQAAGANPIPILVPCHRVLGTHGLGGYSAGLNIKRLLLELEGAKLSPTHYA